MTAPYDWLHIVEVISGALGTLVTLLGFLAALWKFPSLRPVLAGLALALTASVPNGVLVYVYLYAAATNASRLVEAPVFIALTAQLALLVSLYTFVWGRWIYPRLSPWLHAPSASAPPAPQRPPVARVAGQRRGH